MLSCNILKSKLDSISHSQEDESTSTLAEEPPRRSERVNQCLELVEIDTKLLPGLAIQTRQLHALHHLLDLLEHSLLALLTLLMLVEQVYNQVTEDSLLVDYYDGRVQQLLEDPYVATLFKQDRVERGLQDVLENGTVRGVELAYLLYQVLILHCPLAF